MEEAPFQEEKNPDVLAEDVRFDVHLVAGAKVSEGGSLWWRESAPGAEVGQPGHGEAHASPPRSPGNHRDAVSSSRVTVSRNRPVPGISGKEPPRRYGPWGGGGGDVMAVESFPPPPPSPPARPLEGPFQVHPRPGAERGVRLFQRSGITSPKKISPSRAVTVRQAPHTATDWPGTALPRTEEPGDERDGAHSGG